MIEISVIIPIYNVASYLCHCIDSISLLDNNETEVILVNDGSIDESGLICDAYLKKYKNIRVIHKLNGGLSDARNVGTEVSQGEYIFYLDSDDWIIPDAIEIMHQFAVKNDCDVVQGGFYYAFNDHLEFDNRWFESTETPFILTRHQAMAELVKNNFVKNFAWGKLYKTSIAKRHKFPLGKYYEDSYWQHLIINEVERYGVIPKPLYYYRQRRDSISGMASERLLDLFGGLEQRLNFLVNNYPELASQQADRLWKMGFSNHNKSASFHERFQRIDTLCTPLLSDSFKTSAFYSLAARNSSLLPAYQFLNRVWVYFTAKRLQRINLVQ